MHHPPQIKHTIPWLTIAGATLMVLGFLFLGAAPESLVYSREAIAYGEFWRLITGHLVHCDIEHLVWNVGAFVILGSLAEQRMGVKMVTLTTLSCLGVSGYLWVFNTDLMIYCGLSGALNGILAVVLAQLWWETKHPILPLIAVASVAKIIIEITTRHALFTDISWGSVPDAHGAGFMVGIFYLAYASWRITPPAINLTPNRIFTGIENGYKT